MPTVETLFVTRKELAERMGVPYANLIGWEKSGDLPKPIKIKGSRLYRRSQIDAFLEQFFTKEELNCG